MTAAPGLAALAEALPADSVEEHAPLDIDGVQPTVTLRPSDGDAVGAALAALARGGLATLVRGGGTRFPCGNPPCRADVVLSTERIAGVDEFEPGEGVCHHPPRRDAAPLDPLDQLRRHRCHGAGDRSGLLP